MSSTADIKSHLLRVRSLEFEAATDAATGWNGRGTGTVDVSQPAEDIVLFRESGTWRTESGSAIRFTNTYRWNMIGDVLRLEHLRFGENSPVFLFEMAADVTGAWRNVEPLLCQDDCYSATMSLEYDRILVAWTVAGPQKRESIKYEYR